MQLRKLTVSGITLNFLALLTCLNILFASADKQVSGIVFNDVNKNKKMDVNEPGISGVVVSNQLDVTVSDKKGRFTLPVLDRMIIFITKPSTYSLALNEDNLPQFYYIHRPKGSLDTLKYPGIQPTGNLPETILFPLYEDEYREDFNALIVGDPQTRDSVEVGYFRDDIVAEMIGKDASLYMALGDIAFDDLNIYEQYNQVVSKIGIPAFNVTGNHDENYKVPSDRNALDTFNRIFGPEYYSINYGKVHFIVLDDVEYLGWDSEKKKSRGYRGYISDKQLQWLENDLKFVPDDYLIVITKHIPIYTNYSDGDNVNVVNREKLFKIFEKRQHLLALSGHMHTIEHLYFSKDMGWKGQSPFYSCNLGAGCGAWWSGPKDDRGIPESHCMDGSPNGYFLFSFNGNAFDYKFHPVKFNENYQMRISSPTGTLDKAAVDKTKIIVNVFDAGPGTKVYCQLDNGTRQVMERKNMKDPYMIAYLKSNKDNFASWINDVAKTDHIWVAELPKTLDIGSHLIKISATDQRGKIYSGIRIFEISQ